MSDPGLPYVKVSIALWTYNHEQFIAQAIESVLMQQTDFKYELIIGEDCSTDGTRAIVVEYAQRFPDRIRPLLHEHNVGGHANSTAVLNACRGRYIALLDGDDYWTDPQKLQKQLEFLDAHPGCAACFHQAIVLRVDSTTPTTHYCDLQQGAELTLDELLLGNVVPTCSVMFRNELFPELPPWFDQITIGDWSLHVLNAEHGNFGYMDEVMATYRAHQGGMWSSRSAVRRITDIIAFYAAVRDHLGVRYERAIHRGTTRYLDLYARDLIQRTEVGFQGQAETELDELVRSWPATLPSPHSWTRGVKSELYTSLLFRAHASGSSREVKRLAWPALRYNSSLRRNRGFWSAVLQANGIRRHSRGVRAGVS